VGSLFQGRFKAVLVEDDLHSWELSRYVHLNPVRAKDGRSTGGLPLEQLSGFSRSAQIARVA